jgi:23S rRNA (guanosine2251-2'-O)-methyltransferase
VEIFGLHAVRAWLKSAQPQPGDQLWVDGRRHDKRIQQLIGDAKRQGVAVHPCSRKELDRDTGGAVHQGVMVRPARPRATVRYDENWLQDRVAQRGEALLLLVLDGITDPHNLGACLRSAEAAGVDAVVVPRDRSVGITPVVRKVASGAAERVPLVTVTNLSRVLKWLADEGVWVVGTAGEADELLYAADLRGALALVMGAEGDGMRRLTKAQCTQLVKIPLLGSVSSLNVSVAAGVVLFEALRQRHLPL